MHTKKGSGRRFQVSGNNIVLLLALLFVSVASNAQCAMCRAALEGEGNATKAEAVNDGIVYLMAIPYILVAIIFFYIYQTQIGKKKA